MRKILSITCAAILLFGQIAYATNLETAIPNNESEFGPEFLQALSFAYETGLTKFKTVNSFEPYNKISREQTAAMMGKFAHSILGFDLDTSKPCDFNDISDVDSTLYTRVMMACHTGLFNGTSDGYLNPKNDLTKAEGIAVMMRMFKGEKLDESSDPWYRNYYTEAKKIGLTKEPKVESLDRPMTRYETILLLYRFYVKYNLLELSDKSALDGNEIIYGIHMLNDDIVYIDSQSFLDENTDEIYAQIFGTTYRLEKANLISQFIGAYTWYGNVYTDIKQVDGSMVEEYVGVATFNIINEIMTDGNIRPIEFGDNYYSLIASDIKPFYQIQEVTVTESNSELNPNIESNQIDGELINENGTTIYNSGFVSDSGSVSE